MKRRTSSQLELLSESPEAHSGLVSGCQIVPVGKRRDGGTRYWCLAHKADATAKYGRPAESCRAAHIMPIPQNEMLTLDFDAYGGGIGIWGAVPPIFDTTRLPLDRGIHVHARITAGGDKLIDKTFRSLTLKGGRMPPDGMVVSEIDAIYYMVSSVFGFSVKYIQCTHCGYAHLDKDWFSVHPHRTHLCAGCGKKFRDADIAVGNPLKQLRDLGGTKPQKPVRAKKTLSIRQRDFPGGIQIWGSNPAIIWSGKEDEEEGIHVHAFENEGGKADSKADPDGTFSEVTIDGVSLDPLMVRTLMAQSALPHIAGRVVPLQCPTCGTMEFASGELAFRPTTEHRCPKCGDNLRGPGRLRKTIGNPLIKTLDRLASYASRLPQIHEIGLLPETL